jgi:hypothetical protein
MLFVRRMHVRTVEKPLVQVGAMVPIIGVAMMFSPCDRIAVVSWPVVWRRWRHRPVVVLCMVVLAAARLSGSILHGPRRLVHCVGAGNGPPGTSGCVSFDEPSR